MADEQRIAHRLAQAGERMADRGLREVQPLGGAAYATLVDDRLEDDEQVEVDARQINHVHEIICKTFSSVMSERCLGWDIPQASIPWTSS
ncbi:MAG TPA: hypothetical protein VJ454_04635, partial [Steroidobacteraceae bacterium]|nr:hypothetical protein [Steroidobacteraceae bacterium]